MIKTMNTILKFALSLIAIVCFPMSMKAQDINYEDLSQLQLQQRVKERVKFMYDYVSFMADKSKTQKTRYYYCKKALQFFIGKGYEYEENGVTKQGVMMQTTSINRLGVKKTLLRDYFRSLVNLRYSKVNITSVEIADVQVSDLKRVDSSDNKALYMCTCQYVEYYRFDGGLDRYDGVYVQKSTKRIVCYVELDEVLSCEIGKPNYYEHKILLGDVESISTERL